MNFCSLRGIWYVNYTLPGNFLDVKGNPISDIQEIMMGSKFMEIRTSYVRDCMIKKSPEDVD